MMIGITGIILVGGKFVSSDLAESSIHTHFFPSLLKILGVGHGEVYFSHGR